MTRLYRSHRLRGPRGKETITPPLDPSSLAAQAERHIAWLTARGFSHHTLRSRAKALVAFTEWCAQRGVYKPDELSPLILDLYQRHVSKLIKKDAMPLAPSSQHKKLVAVVVFGRWLVRDRLIATNPAADLGMPKTGIRLPAAVLTVEEAEKILAVPDVTTPLGLRDRAIMEVFYSTGIRRAELAYPPLPILTLAKASSSCARGRGRRTVLCRLESGRWPGCSPISAMCVRTLLSIVTKACCF